jgi:hypothetical protein
MVWTISNPSDPWKLNILPIRRTRWYIIDPELDNHRSETHKIIRAPEAFEVKKGFPGSSVVTGDSRENKDGEELGLVDFFYFFFYFFWGMREIEEFGQIFDCMISMHLEK